jgi:hypothetical protein
VDRQEAALAVMAIPYVDGSLLQGLSRKLIGSLLPYVRPVDATANGRWPRWFPQREFQTASRPVAVTGSCGVSRALDRSIIPSACFLQVQPSDQYGSVRVLLTVTD